MISCQLNLENLNAFTKKKKKKWTTACTNLEAASLRINSKQQSSSEGFASLPNLLGKFVENSALTDIQLWSPWVATLCP